MKRLIYIFLITGMALVLTTGLAAAACYDSFSDRPRFVFTHVSEVRTVMRRRSMEFDLFKPGIATLVQVNNRRFPSMKHWIYLSKQNLLVNLAISPAFINSIIRDDYLFLSHDIGEAVLRDDVSDDHLAAGIGLQVLTGVRSKIASIVSAMERDVERFRIVPTSTGIFGIDVIPPGPRVGGVRFLIESDSLAQKAALTALGQLRPNSNFSSANQASAFLRDKTLIASQAILHLADNRLAGFADPAHYVSSISLVNQDYGRETEDVVAATLAAIRKEFRLGRP